ncbi:MAG: hypothetical protein Aurels2KO_21520 [Aureliella sp.]
MTLKHYAISVSLIAVSLALAVGPERETFLGEVAKRTAIALLVCMLARLSGRFEVGTFILSIPCTAGLLAVWWDYAVRSNDPLITIGPETVFFIECIACSVVFLTTFGFERITVYLLTRRRNRE